MSKKGIIILLAVIVAAFAGCGTLCAVVVVSTGNGSQQPEAITPTKAAAVAKPTPKPALTVTQVDRDKLVVVDLYARLKGLVNNPSASEIRQACRLRNADFIESDRVHFIAEELKFMMSPEDLSSWCGRMKPSG